MLNQIAMLRRTIFYIKMIRNEWTLLDISRTDLYLKLLEIFKKSVEDRNFFAIADSEESCAQYLLSLPMTAFMLDNLKTLESELTQEESYITSLTEDLEPEQEVWMKLWDNDLKQVETEWEIILKKDGVSSASASAGAGAGTSRQEVQVVQVQEEDGDTSVSGRKRKGKDALEG